MKTNSLGTPDLLPSNFTARFWSKVSISSPSECWLWNGAKSGAVGGKNYGHILLNGHMTRAHRISYYIQNGVIPDGGVICHSCDNTLCVNPSHLWLGTQRDNMRDMISKGRNNIVMPNTYGEDVTSRIFELHDLGYSGISIARETKVSRRRVLEILKSGVQNG